MAFNKTYADIVSQFRTACDLHAAIASFDTGTIDFLDASSQNIKYPYIYLRPISSPGYVERTKTLNFELYSLDIPKLDNQSPVHLQSQTEQYILDLLAYFNVGDVNIQQTYDVTVNNITPVNESFEDRAYGWVADISVTVPFTLDYCSYPTDNEIWFGFRAGILGTQSGSFQDATFYEDQSQALYVRTNSTSFPENIISKQLFASQSVFYPLQGNPFQDNNFVSFKSGSDIGHATHFSRYGVIEY
jgi:hypothetical protein